MHDTVWATSRSRLFAGRLAACGTGGSPYRKTHEQHAVDYVQRTIRIAVDNYSTLLYQYNTGFLCGVYVEVRDLFKLVVREDSVGTGANPVVWS